MGILPGGAGDVNTSDGLFLLSAHGTGTSSVSQLASQDQDTVNAAYRQKYVHSSGSVYGDPNGPLAKLFAGGSGHAGFSGLPGVIGALVSALTGQHGPWLDLNSIINAVEQVPVLGQFVQLAEQVATGFKNLFDGWFGRHDGTGTPSEVATVVASMRTAVLEGWNIAIFTTSNPAWLVPENTVQMIGCVINGGGKGGTGRQSSGGNGSGTAAPGGTAGSSGGYLSAELDLTGVTPGESTLSIVVGAAATSAGTDGGQSSISIGSTVLLAGAPNANGIASAQGLLPTTSRPGAGGVGAGIALNGDGNALVNVPGTPGEDSGVAKGGQAGASAFASGLPSTATGQAGSKGGDGIAASVPICGGAGGGGGGAGIGGYSLVIAAGGNGGDGGFPGGGSGGGGAVSSTLSRSPGTGGIPGNGLVAILYK
ncbi:minor tail protein [Mycobacterium phage Mendokysei]|uniref:Minor tail protein n=1 Tax=Mycobacterium phage Mendokysei TaxID=2099637 RepID=A0A2P1CG92_9CAUD|nr:minor tail protein [Mycobacterium phage Mendokysei]AVJ50238.1 minor tail protein [Mycobacterium phage Mendokysei]